MGRMEGAEGHAQKQTLGSQYRPDKMAMPQWCICILHTASETQNLHENVGERASGLITGGVPTKTGKPNPAAH